MLRSRFGQGGNTHDPSGSAFAIPISLYDDFEGRENRYGFSLD